MAQIARRRIIGAKIETTQNTPAAPAAGDFFWAYDVQVQPLGEQLERPYVSASLDPYSNLIGKKWMNVKFKADLKGSGTAGTAPPIGPILQACGMTETIVAVTSVTYAPSSVPASSSFFSPGKSCTLTIHEDGGAVNGPKYVVAGAVGNPKLTLEAGKIPYVEFDMLGIYTAVTDAAIPANTPVAGDPPVMKSATLLLQTYAAIASKLEIDFGNVISERTDLNSANSILGFQITGRKPTGSADPEMVPVATHDFWGKFMSGNLASSSIVAGASAGNICTITMPKTQYGQPSMADRNGISTLQVPLVFSRNSGDDWISIAFT